MNLRRFVFQCIVQSKRQAFWKKRARAEAILFNLGWWTQCFMPWLLWSALVATAVILTERFMGMDPKWGGVVFFLILAMGATAAFWATHHKWISTQEALVKLDAGLRLHNTLTCADEGRVDWPQENPAARLGLRWNAGRLLIWPAAGAAVLAIALTAPIPIVNTSAAHPHGQPSAWSALEETITTLETEDLVRQQALDDFRKALEDLSAQPADQWFSHESLEAGDHLNSSAQSGVQDLQEGFEQALAAMEVARQLDEARLASHSQLLGEHLQAALQQLSSGTLPLDPDFLPELENLDLSSVRQLSSEEWKKIQDRLKEGLSTCSGGFSDGEEASSELMAALAAQSGGGTEGGASAPLAMSGTGTELGTKKIEAVTNDDLSNAALGDPLGLGTTDHLIDPDKFESAQPGGSIPATASGSGVSMQTATPDEQRVLKQFFR